MVEHALHELSAKNILELDEERKAAMVSNLLVVLCSESETQPVINTGSLYTQARGRCRSGVSSKRPAGHLPFPAPPVAGAPG